MSANSNSGDLAAAGFSRRMSWLTAGIGLAAAGVVMYRVSWRAGVGIAIGTVLAWLGFRALEQFGDVMVKAAEAQRENARVNVPDGIYLRLIGRYVLIGAVTCVILKFSDVPLLSVIAGLLSVGAAAMAEGIYEVMTGCG
jgi:hypothetical protein